MKLLVIEFYGNCKSIIFDKTVCRPFNLAVTRTAIGSVPVGTLHSQWQQQEITHTCILLSSLCVRFSSKIYSLCQKYGIQS